MQRLLVTSMAAAACAAFVLVASASPSPSKPSKTATADAAVTDGATSIASEPCGRDGGLDCPLQAWMKVNAGPPSKTGDIELLAAAFDAIAGFAPHASAYPNWASIARDGASVARRGRVDAARVACVSCHEQYRARFRRDLRSVPLAALADAGEIEGGKP
jgi:hypothetical protein